MLNSISYNTKQKEIILEFLKNNKNLHLTAEDIIFGLKNNGTPVGKTTVYRALEKFEEKNLIRRFITTGNSSCFQYIGENSKCTSHYHLKCNLCNKLFHVSNNNLDKALSSIMKNNNFTIDNSKTVFYGICRDCENKN